MRTLVGGRATEPHRLMSEGASERGETTSREGTSHGEPMQTQAYYVSELEGALAVGDRAREARARCGLARSASANGEQWQGGQAATEYKRAVAIYLEMGDRARVADIRYELACVELEDEEVKTYARAAAAMHEGPAPRQTWRLEWANNASRAYFMSKDAMHERARAECHGAGELYRELGNLAGEAKATCLLASISSEQEADEQARAEYNRALELYREVGDHEGEANARQGLAEVDRVIQRIRELEPAASVQVAKRRESHAIRFSLRLFALLALLAALLIAVRALTGMDSEWPFYLLFALGAGFSRVPLENSRAPVKIGLLGFAFGASLAIAIWLLTGMGSTLPFLALLVWGWACASGAIKGRRRIADPSESDTRSARSIARSAALAEAASQR